MLRIAFLMLGAVSVIGFLLTGVLQTSAEARFPKVQWVVEGRPIGAVERAGIEGLPTLKGNGPEGSIFIERRHRDRSRPFALEGQIYPFARLGCVAALLTSIFGFFAHRNLERAMRIERGDAPS